MSAPALVLSAVLGLVLLAFTQCGVAEVAVRLAAVLYGQTAQERRDKSEEWIRDLQDMKPHERPSHAGSLLWAGFSRAAFRSAASLAERGVNSRVGLRRRILSFRLARRSVTPAQAEVSAGDTEEQERRLAQQRRDLGKTRVREIQLELHEIDRDSKRHYTSTGLADYTALKAELQRLLHPTDQEPAD